MGPRWFDPVTAGERQNLIGMFARSSVMDVAGDATQMMLGLGSYDFAATALLYGAVAGVHARPGEGVGTSRGRGETEANGDGGGLFGYHATTAAANGQGPQEILSSALQGSYELIDPASCHAVDPTSLRPAAWDDARLGTFHPLLDGHVVSVDGEPTRCRQGAVAPVVWTSLRAPDTDAGEATAPYEGAPSIDRDGRVRVAYRAATDRFAAPGNIGASRADAGADAYEIADHLVTKVALEQIFDDRGRGRAESGVLGTAHLRFARSLEQLRDGEKGVTLLQRRLLEVAAEPGVAQDPAALWAYTAQHFAAPQILAAAAAIDQLTTRMAIPVPGEHVRPAGETVLRSRDSGVGLNQPTLLVIRSGAVAVSGLVAPGGQEIVAARENGIGDAVIVGASGYFDKAYGSLLFTESVDGFDPNTVDPVLSPLQGALSPADLFPDAYRRWLANALTSDDELKGVRFGGGVNGSPDGFGFTSYWAPRPEVCFTDDGGHVCGVYGAPDGLPEALGLPMDVAIVDPQMGWEHQKFMLVWAYVFLPRRGQSDWLSLLEADNATKDGDPGYVDRIELHLPLGDVLVARTFGVETLFGETVQRGIAARVFEQANQLMSEAYQGQWLTAPNGVTKWFLADIDPATGEPVIISDGKHFAFQKQRSVSWLLARLTSWAKKNESALYP